MNGRVVLSPFPFPFHVSFLSPVPGGYLPNILVGPCTRLLVIPAVLGIPLVRLLHILELLHDSLYSIRR